MRKLLNDIRSIVVLTWLNGSLPALRGPLYVVMYTITPISVLFFVSIYGSGIYVPIGYAGGLLMIIIASGLAVIGDTVWYKIESKFQDMIVASPVSPLIYAIGIGISELSYTLPVVVLFLAIIIFLHIFALQNLFAILLVACAAWMMAASIGFTAATYMRSIKNAWPISALLSIVLSFAPPIFYPISIIPEPARALVYLLPTTYAGLLLHDAIGVERLTLDVRITYWLILLLLTAGFAILASVKSRWREA